MIRKAKKQTYQDMAIGPQQPGGVYRCGYWNVLYTVTKIERKEDGRFLIHAHDIEGSNQRPRVHCTAWDAKRDRVISQPGQ